MLKNFIPPIFFMIASSLKRKFRKDYVIGDYKIKLSKGHTLPDFQAQNKLYDRFLPALSAHFKQGETIVDVGANIGDSAIMMLNNTEANIICVEPSDIYYPYLEENIKRLPQAVQAKVKCIKALAGTQELSGELVHTGGTASLQQDGNSSSSTIKKQLDELLVNEDNISLIKVDTDGYDFDVLLSAKQTIVKQQPILFWENQINNEMQLEGYTKLYTFLKELGYSHIYLFDNFGNVMLEEVDFKALQNINAYVNSMDKHNCTRTIYYTDVLAAPAAKQSMLQNIIEEYKRDWVRA